MGKDGIKISFRGIGEIIGGAGRSPLSFLSYVPSLELSD